MVSGNGAPTLGELARSQSRIEAVLARMEIQQEERHDQIVKQVSDVRHRVANLEAERVLSKDFFKRVGSLFDRVEAIEKKEIADEAVTNFKKYVLGGSFLGVVLVVLQIWSLIR